MRAGRKKKSGFDQALGDDSLSRLAIGDFELFCRIIDAGGFRVAARQLGLTQSHVTRRLQAIEAMMGGQLLFRTTRQLQITPLGERFLTEARQFSSYSTYLKRMVDRQPAHSLVTAEQLYERARNMGVYYRDPVLEQLAEHASDPAMRLVTLTGTGGVGKTTVLRVLHAQLTDLRAESSLWIDIATSNTREQFLDVLASKLLGNIGNRADPLEALIRQLRRSALVLALDNVEQVDGAGETLQQLLGACPALKVIVSSRRPLRCRLERQLRINPLSIPARECANLNQALRHEGFDLLRITMAQHVSGKLTIDENNWMHYASALQTTGGLPLGIELLAARTVSIGVVAAGQLLLQPFVTSPLSRENRHSSIYNCLLASWDLLSPSARQYLVCFSFIPESLDFDEASILSNAVGIQYPELVIDDLLGQGVLENRDGFFFVLAPVREFVLQHARTVELFQPIGKQFVQWVARVAQDTVSLVYQHNKIDSALALATQIRKSMVAAIRLQSDLNIYCDPDIDLTISSALRLAFLVSGQTYGLASLMQIAIVRSIHLSKNMELAAFALYQFAYAQNEIHQYARAEETIKQADLLDAPPSRRIHRIRRRLVLDSAIYSGKTDVAMELSRIDYIELARARGKTLNSYRESYAYMMLIAQEYEEVESFGKRPYVRREFSSNALQSLCGKVVIASAKTMLGIDPDAPQELRTLLRALSDRAESVMLRHRVDVICCGVFCLYLTGNSIDLSAETLRISRLALMQVAELESQIACLLATTCAAIEHSLQAETHHLMEVIRYQLETSGARLPLLHSRVYVEIQSTLQIQVDALKLNSQELTEYVLVLLTGLEKSLG